MVVITDNQISQELGNGISAARHLVLHVADHSAAMIEAILRSSVCQVLGRSVHLPSDEDETGEGRI
jgi:hypothetical protein